MNDLVQKMFLMQNYRDELLNPEKILFNPDSKTIFKQAIGTVQINSGKEGRMRINVTSTALNGILSGKIDVKSNTIDAVFNTIFLTGSRQKQIPINIATGLKGEMSNISQNTNLDQARQYLGLIKNKTADAAQVDMPANSGLQNSQLLPAPDRPQSDSIDLESKPNFQQIP